MKNKVLFKINDLVLRLEDVTIHEIVTFKDNGKIIPTLKRVVRLLIEVTNKSNLHYGLRAIAEFEKTIKESNGQEYNYFDIWSLPKEDKMVELIKAAGIDFVSEEQMK